MRGWTNFRTACSPPLTALSSRMFAAQSSSARLRFDTTAADGGVLHFAVKNFSTKRSATVSATSRARSVPLPSASFMSPELWFLMAA